MTKEITMPRLSETMPDGKILSWHKKINDTVNKGDVIAEVETDKANMEIEAVDYGVITDILVLEGQIAKVGEPIAILNGEKPDKSQKPQETQQPQKTEAKPKEVKAKEPEQPKTDKQETPKQQEEIIQKKPEEKKSEFKASLLVRNLAEKHDIDLNTIKGTGPKGQIKKNDVLAYINKSEKKETTHITQGRAEDKEPLTKIRSTIATRMTQSKQTTPHFYVTYEVKADKLVEYYNNLQKKIADITYNDIFIKAIAIELHAHPLLNSSYRGDYIEINKEINIGIAFATENGLLVPVVHYCDKKSLTEINNATKEIKDRVKNNKLKPEDMTGGTFSISNLGMYGVHEFMAIINPPEAAGLAIGAIRQAAIVSKNEVKAGHLVNLTLSGDHRVMDGAEAALFLKELNNILNYPEKIENV